MVELAVTVIVPLSAGLIQGPAWLLHIIKGTGLQVWRTADGEHTGIISAGNTCR